MDRIAIWTRLSRCTVWLVALTIAIFTLCPIQFRPMTAAPADLERWLAFAVLGGLLAVAYPKHRVRFALLAIACAAILEMAQNLTSSRHGHLSDFDVKAIGIVAGMALGAWLLRGLAAIARL